MTKRGKIEADTRTLMQGAKLAISDVFDAIAELVTNADDRYQILKVPGKVVIEVERRRKDSRGILRVRDFADGMTRNVMIEKLGRMGGRVSGLEQGLAVRGTNSRGAKDIAALGDVAFESIAADKRFHRFDISAYFDFSAHDSVPVSDELREQLGLPTGTGTVVTIHLDKNQRIPQHEPFVEQLSRLVSLRDILCNPQRPIILRDLNQNREDILRAPTIDGTERVSERFEVPGYPGATAKLTIKRAHRPFDRENPRFRLGGILVKSRHAVHESSLFDSSLESDMYAQHFFGRLVCEKVDDLWNDYDQRFEEKRDFSPDNPVPVIDPSRKTGLTRTHPFVQALCREVLKRLRPLVEEERKRAESEKVTVENSQTRRRLNELEKAASEFLRDHSAEDDVASDPNRQHLWLRLKRKGYDLQPPYARLVIGQSAAFTFTIMREAYPEFEVGSGVSVETLSNAIHADTSVGALEAHPTREDILRMRFKVTAREESLATGVRVRLNAILVDSPIEVLATEADKYRDITSFTFERRRYSGTCGTKRKKIRLIAPLNQFAEPAVAELKSDSKRLTVPNTVSLNRLPDLGIAVAQFVVQLPDQPIVATVRATALDQKAETEIRVVPDPGSALKIRIEDIDLGNQRYRMRNNVIEIAAKHPSLRRYLGSKADNFVGQDAQHFRVLIAEIVADAVCADIVSRSMDTNPEEYANADWDRFYAEYSEYMTKFLPIAHRIVLPTPT